MSNNFMLVHICIANSKELCMQIIIIRQPTFRLRNMGVCYRITDFNLLGCNSPWLATKSNIVAMEINRLPGNSLAIPRLLAAGLFIDVVY
jgi:hypothetical protein